MHAVELKAGTRFGFFRVRTWSRVVLKTGPSFFHCFPHFNVFFGACLKNTSSVNLCKVVFLQIVGMSNMRFSKRKLHFCLVFFMLLQEKQKKEKKQNGKQPKTYNNNVIEVVIQK